MTKSPYEIRLDILALSNEILTSQLGRQPKTEEILSEAESLYSFVSDNSSRSLTTKKSGKAD